MQAVGIWQVRTVEWGSWRIDGGSLFGTVPRVMWEKWLEPDASHRVVQAARSLAAQCGDRTVLVDAGFGDKWDERARKIFEFSPASAGQALVQSAVVTDIVLTHLHFDHAGGVSRYAADGATVEPVYPCARVYLQRDNLAAALRPNARERASYLLENAALLQGAGVQLLDGACELLPGVLVERSDGHTQGLQWVRIQTADGWVVFPGDIVPTAHHLPVNDVTGFEMRAELLLQEKEALLAQAVEQEWVVVFCHDPEVAAATVTRDARGKFAVRERVRL